MKRLHIWILGVFLMLSSLYLPAAAAGQSKFKEQEAEIYTRMKRYGISRDDVAALRRLYETTPPYSDPHIWVEADKLLNPGEHYRMEMDEFILTMKVPEAKPMIAGQSIWPYTTTRPLEPALAKNMAWERTSSLKIAALAWHMCSNSFTTFLVGADCPTTGGSINYHILTPERVLNLSTPAAMIRAFTDVQKAWVPTQAEIERNERKNLIDNRFGNRIVLVPEPVVINGRIWIRQIMDDLQSRNYQYTTFLAPDRMLRVSLDAPYLNGARPNPNAVEYPPPLPKAVKLIEELLASIRIVKTNDDGAPDLFMLERVELGPLPVREKRPASE